jgi:PAS domain S-box-containing protein
MMHSDAPIHFLLVEDDPEQVQFLKLTLRTEQQSPFTMTHAASLAEAMSALAGFRPDIILLDLHLPDSAGLDTPRAMLRQAPDIPLIIYSGNTDIEIAVEAVRLGAQDYLLKGEAREPLLSRAMRYAIERKRIAMERDEARVQLEERNAALEQARGELRTERDMFVSGPTVLFRREIAPGFPITFVSRNVSQFGYLPRDLVGAGVRFDSLVVADDRESFREQLDARFAQGAESIEQEYRILDAKGAVVWLHEVARLQRDADGRPVAQLAYVVDITRRRAAEESLSDTRNRFESVLGSISDVVYECGTDGRIVDISPSVERALGRTAGELRGRPFGDLVVEEQRAGWDETFRHILGGVTNSCEFPLSTADGGVRLFEISARRIAEGGVIRGIAGTLTDVTGRRETEHAIRNVRSQMQQYLDLAEVVFLSLDLRGAVSFINRKGCELLGYREHEITGRDWFDLCIPAPERAELRRYFLQIVEGSAPQPEVNENIVLRKTGEVLVIRWHNALMRDARGAVMGVLSSGEDVTDQRRVEQEARGSQKQIEIVLQDSEKKFRLLAEQSSDVIWTVNADFKLTFVSPSVEFVLGYTPEEVMRMDFFDVLEDDFRRENQEPFKQLMREAGARPPQERGIRVEIPFKKKDGSVIWIEAVATPVLDDENAFRGIQGSLRDIHHRKLAQLALAESEEKYRLLVQNQTDLVIKLDLDGNFLFVSPSYCRMFGRTEEELLGQTFFPHVHEDDRISTLEAMKLLFEPPYTTYVEQRALTRDGWRWLGWQDTAVRDENGEVTAVVGVGRDVTERRMAERALIESEKRLRTVISNLPVIMFTLDRDGIFTMSEGKGLETLGLHPGQVVGHSAFDVYVNHPEVLANIRRALAGEAFVASVEVEGKFFETWYSPVVGDNGRIEHIIGVAFDITERKITEQELNQYRNHLEELVEARTLALERANERLKRFRFALDSAVDNIYIIDPATMKYVDVNDSAVQALGWSREELLTMGPADIQTGTDRDTAMNVYGQVRDGALDVGIFETVHHRKDGGSFPAEVVVRAFDSGEQSLLIATARDVTRRRTDELALKESEAKYRNVLENANEAIIVLQDNRLRFFNYKVLELTGLSEEALHDIPIFEFVHPEDHALLLRQYEERLRGGLLPESYEVRMFDSNGTIKWMEGRDVPITWEGKPATLNFFNDITARKQAEDYIRFQASLLSIVRNAVVALDATGRVTYWNSFAEIMYGWSAADVLGKKLHDVPTFGTDFESILLPALKERGHWEGEVERPRRDGVMLSVYSLWNVIRQDEQLRGYVGIGMDLSERKKLERELLQSQKLASLGILSEGIAHELRNPLGYASSAAQLLISKKDLSEEDRKKYSRVIHTGVDRANKIVENLLLIGKPKGQLMKKQLDLVDTVQEALSLITSHHNAAGIQTQLEFGAKPLLIQGNREMLVQLFYNLFTNALDAMAGSGSIRVSGEEKGGSVRIRVSDTGPGVPDDIVENIFDPFFTTSKTDKGVGLGLTLCYFIMDDHEGRIELDTTARTGAAFLLTFPAA